MGLAPPPLGQGEKTPYIRRKISVYKKIYFRIYEKIFSHMRKFIFVRTEINFLPQGNKFSCGRNFFSVRTKISRSAEGEKSTFEGGEIFLRKKIFFRAHGNFAPSAEPFFSLGKQGNSEGESAFFWRGEGEDFLGKFGRLSAEEISLQCDYLWKVVDLALHR